GAPGRNTRQEHPAGAPGRSTRQEHPAGTLRVGWPGCPGLEPLGCPRQLRINPSASCEPLIR
ncbi:MAG: hypothetical protein J6P50_03375, partial [Bacteroidales bacterium]|nr:hypothetical protein [Bacteroidales bacterium]